MEKLSQEKLKKRVTVNWEMLLLVVIVLGFSIVVGSINPVFWSVDNFRTILHQYSAVGVAAVGMTLVIISGGIDLSAGWSIALGAVTMGAAYQATQSPVAGMLAAVAICTGVGALNGFLVTKTKLIPFVATLATMSIAQGFLNIISEGKRVALDDAMFKTLNNTSVGPVSLPTVLMVAAIFVGFILLRKTVLGTYTYSMGADVQNTELAGVNVPFYKFWVYTVAGAFVGMAAILLGVRLTTVSGSITGNSLLMDIIAAVVLGGASIVGGKGSVWGTLVGVILIGVITNACTLLRVNSTAIDLFKGAAIIVALVVGALAAYIQKQSEKKEIKKMKAYKMAN
ncbi:ABC transporter permease [Christensenella tenuis]|jgi:ribose/xylose/arabinose/galactoside ABC-type transport system permease subunit|uniref:ABC transporter permease n=1 Tax=Christensenella tenuis TaxID=2763033 RepID=A0ABR7EHA0_9FIRM|nr:ABC transporter permease [Christensenella tenuis]MBC5648538.1 ABC transporter permease [Christensenella tenuis]